MFLELIIHQEKESEKLPLPPPTTADLSHLTWYKLASLFGFGDNAEQLLLSALEGAAFYLFPQILHFGGGGLYLCYRVKLGEDILRFARGKVYRR